MNNFLFFPESFVNQTDTTHKMSIIYMFSKCHLKIILEWIVKEMYFSPVYITSTESQVDFIL